MAHWSEKPDAIRYGVIQVLRNARGECTAQRYDALQGGGGGGGGGEGGGGGGGVLISVGCIFYAVHALE